jgi:hypothetical protein
VFIEPLPRNDEGEIMESGKTSVARERFGKHVPATMDTHATIQELLKIVFSMWSVPKLYNENFVG